MALLKQFFCVRFRQIIPVWMPQLKDSVVDLNACLAKMSMRVERTTQENIKKSS